MMSVKSPSPPDRHVATPRSHLAGWLAWSLTALTLLAAGPMVYFATANGQTSLENNILTAVMLLVFSVMGSLVASYRPSNSIGWILCFVALVSITGNLSVEYGVYGLVRYPGAAPGALWAALYGSVARASGWCYMVALIPLYFPNGRLPSARWRWAVRAIIVASVALALGMMLGPIADYNDARLIGQINPIAILPAEVAGSIVPLSILLLFIVALFSVWSVVVRFWHARGIERQQLKWFVYATALSALISGFLLAAIFLSLKIDLSGAIWFVATVGMPIAVCIAVLRYRLYDIDFIINRTLVYGSLTVILAALYFGLVIGAQALTEVATGQRAGEQPLVIVLSTVLIAALFQPLRGWLQRWIDRRFYRSHYDATKTLAGFSAALRSEIDLSQLSDHLLLTVEETMRPAHVSLWLRIPQTSGQMPLAEPRAD